MPTYEADDLQPSRPPAAVPLAARVFVSYNASNQFALTAAGAAADGVTRYAVTALTDDVTIETDGNLQVTAGGSFNIGDEVQSDANGNAVKWNGTAVKTGLALSAGTSGKLALIKFYDRAQRPPQTRGANVASVAGVLTLPAADYFHITGTNAITGFTNPVGIQDGYRITVIPDALWTWTAATNIALAGSAVVSKALDFVWDATTGKWYPSYIA